MLWATQSKTWHTFFPVAERPLRMEHFVLDNLCNHSKEMPLYDIASCLLGESLIGIDSLVARFHKHFYSTHRSVGVTELTEAKQRQHESVDDFLLYG